MEIVGIMFLEVCAYGVDPLRTFTNIPLLHVNNFTEDNTIFRNRYNLWGG